LQTLSGIGGAVSQAAQEATTAGAKSLGIPGAEKLGRDVGAEDERRMVNDEIAPEVPGAHWV